MRSSKGGAVSLGERTHTTLTVLESAATQEANTKRGSTVNVGSVAHAFTVPRMGEVQLCLGHHRPAGLRNFGSLMAVGVKQWIDRALQERLRE